MQSRIRNFALKTTPKITLATPSSRIAATPVKPLFHPNHLLLQTRQYALSRYPDRRNRFSRSSSSSQKGRQEIVSAPSALNHHQLEDLPDDPRGVLRFDSNKGAALLLGQSSLIVTREIEMMNIFLGYEQANRYALLSPQGAKVGYLMEEETGVLGGAIQRQLLKTHRPFKATVMDLEGNPVLRISRGVTLINSKTRIWSIDQNATDPGPSESRERLVGEVVQNFHVWRRKYELFRTASDEGQRSMGQTQVSSSQQSSSSKDVVPSEKLTEQLDQFAKVDSGLLSWDFLLQDQNGGILGAINRNFRGFGRELFTDTGQYVIRFRDVEPQELHTPARLIETGSGKAVAVNPSGGELILKQDSRPMTLDERAVSLAAAISIDFDYFSRHSSSGGGFMPFFWMGGGSPPPPEGDSDVPSTTSQDSSGIQSSPELPGSDGGLGAGAGTAAGYGLMGGGGRESQPTESPGSFPDSNNFPDSGFSSPPPPEAGTQSDGWGFGSREEQGMGQDEEVWGGGSNDPWAESNQGEEGGGLFSGWGLSDFLGGDD